MKPPQKPRWHRAKTRLFEETIVFTHHFGGHGASTKRHQDFVNALGFDCVSFNLAKDWRTLKLETFRQAWVKQLTGILDQVPGPKILYTFSSPSLATPEVIVDEKRNDIRAWICDGGPFLQMLHCFQNYYRYQANLTGALNQLAAVFAYGIVGCIGLESKVHQWMRDFPKDIPILSIRSGHDKMVPLSAIDEFFAGTSHLNFQKLEIAEAEHLEGLKHFPGIYEPTVRNFLEKISTPYKKI
jgi:hypothetical protein